MDPVLRAAAYDILSDPARRLAREGDFLRRLAGGGRVLDLACATGAHAHFLATHGARVTAQDLDPEMLSMARARRPHPGVEYRRRDMREPTLAGERFDLVMCIGNSLNMLPDPGQVELVLVRAARALAPGGRLLLHVLNPAAAQHRRPTATLKRGCLDGRELLVLKTMAPAGGRRLASFAYFLDAAAGDADDESRQRVLTRAVALLDIGHEFLSRALARAGLTRIEFHGGLDGSAWNTQASPDLVAVATADEDRAPLAPARARST